MTIANRLIIVTSVAMLCAFAQQQCSASQPLPKAKYKAQCPFPPSNGPLYLGQGIPTVYVQGHIDVARDIHWLSLKNEPDLIAYVLTGQSGEIVLVPYTARNIFRTHPAKLGANQYIPLGSFLLSPPNLNARLAKRRLLNAGSPTVQVHSCFSNTWPGTYPHTH